MAELRILSKTEQIAAFLRSELLRGRWQGQMPGRKEIAFEFGLNERAVEDALRLLELDGLLLPQGAGRKRKISLVQLRAERCMKIGLMLYEESDRFLPYLVDLIRRLEEAGHQVHIAEHTLVKLNLDCKKTERMTSAMNVDSWIVMAASKEILRMLLASGKPVMAVFGRFNDLPVAAVGVKKIPALRQVVQRLYQMGHRKIVMMAREERLKPYPAAYERAFLHELQCLGISTSSYHLPEWENHKNGFHRCLDELFRITPPTALLLSEPLEFLAAQQHLAGLGVVAPRDVSLICGDPSPLFDWSEPPVSHIQWNAIRLVRRIWEWADHVSHQIPDLKQFHVQATFVEGGSIGPPCEL